MFKKLSKSLLVALSFITLSVGDGWAYEYSQYPYSLGGIPSSLANNGYSVEIYPAENAIYPCRIGSSRYGWYIRNDQYGCREADINNGEEDFDDYVYENHPECLIWGKNDLVATSGTGSPTIGLTSNRNYHITSVEIICGDGNQTGGNFSADALKLVCTGANEDPIYSYVKRGSIDEFITFSHDSDHLNPNDAMYDSEYLFKANCEQTVVRSIANRSKSSNCVLTDGTWDLETHECTCNQGTPDEYGQCINCSGDTPVWNSSAGLCEACPANTTWDGSYNNNEGACVANPTCTSIGSYMVSNSTGCCSGVEVRPIPDGASSDSDKYCCPENSVIGAFIDGCQSCYEVWTRTATEWSNIGYGGAETSLAENDIFGPIHDADRGCAACPANAEIDHVNEGCKCKSGYKNPSGIVGGQVLYGESCTVACISSYSYSINGSSCVKHDNNSCGGIDTSVSCSSCSGYSGNAGQCCPSGKTWDTSTSSCKATCPTSWTNGMSIDSHCSCGGSFSVKSSDHCCASNYYWGGSSCLKNCPTSWTEGMSIDSHCSCGGSFSEKSSNHCCASGYYWDGTSCEPEITCTGDYIEDSGTCYAQCKNLKENEICFTSSGISSNFSKNFVLDPKVTNSSNPSISECFESGAVSYAPSSNVASGFNPDLGRRFTVSCMPMVLFDDLNEYVND